MLFNLKRKKEMEENKCVICGKPAKYISNKFTSPLCEDCARKEAIKIGLAHGVKEEFIELDDYYTQPCQEMNNIVKELTLNEEKPQG